MKKNLQKKFNCYQICPKKKKSGYALGQADDNNNNKYNKYRAQLFPIF
jgi:hypothetical protein